MNNEMFEAYETRSKFNKKFDKKRRIFRERQLPSVKE